MERSFIFDISGLLMLLKYSFLFFLVLFWIGLAMGQEAELASAIEGMEKATSGERVRAVCMYFDSNVHSRAPEKFDALLAKSYRIAERDKDRDFKEYLDFYQRMKGVLRISDKDPAAREAKMPKLIEKVLSHYQNSGDERFIAICNAYIGHHYFITKQYAKSLEKLLLADQGFKKVGYHKFPDIGKHLHGIALVFYFFRNYEKVAELMEISTQCPPYFRNLNIQRYNTLGAAYAHLKQYDQAIKAFLKTKQTAMAYKDDFWIAYASRNLANIYLEKQDYSQALDLYESNLKFIAPIGKANPREYAEYLLGMAKTYVFLGKLSKAQNTLDKVTYQKNAQAKEPMFLFGIPYQDINYWTDFYDVQRRYHYAIKSYEKAYRYADSLYAMKYRVDSLFNGLEIKVAQNRIETQNKQHQNEKKEATIESKNQQIILIGGLLTVIAVASVLIIRKNRQINRQNKVISAQLGELTKTLGQKQMLLSELQHRVKNNLQHVISILEIQKESVDFNNIDELIRGNQNRIHSMALLHKKLNVTDNVNEVDLNRYVTELAELVKDSYDSLHKKVNLYIKCEVATISIEKALPLGLIIVELVSNSMKHAFKKRNIGIINIEITKNEDQNLLYYSDNGSGFDFNKTSEKGLGQEIIKGLIDQLDGNIQTSSDAGFELKVYFK